MSQHDADLIDEFDLQEETNSAIDLAPFRSPSTASSSLAPLASFPCINAARPVVFEESKHAVAGSPSRQAGGNGGSLYGHLVIPEPESRVSYHPQTKTNAPHGSAPPGMRPTRIEYPSSSLGQATPMAFARPPALPATHQASARDRVHYQTAPMIGHSAPLHSSSTTLYPSIQDDFMPVASQQSSPPPQQFQSVRSLDDSAIGSDKRSAPASTFPMSPNDSAPVRHTADSVAETGEYSGEGSLSSNEAALNRPESEMPLHAHIADKTAEISDAGDSADPQAAEPPSNGLATGGDQVAEQKEVAEGNEENEEYGKQPQVVTEHDLLQEEHKIQRQLNDYQSRFQHLAAALTGSTPHQRAEREKRQMLSMQRTEKRKQNVEKRAQLQVERAKERAERRAERQPEWRKTVSQVFDQDFDTQVGTQNVSETDTNKS